MIKIPYVCAYGVVAKNNSRLRRTIVRILFHSEGGMTRSQVAESLHELGMFRDVPSESSLAALISKNAQVIKIGHTKIELSNGLTVRNMVFDVDRNLIQREEDIELTMPFSCMTNELKENAQRCPKCKQMRHMPEMKVCLVCERRGV
tara:strand:+ start:2121 stop:2561 length:441 start_codon:yes stop_codon:yes gene_type:complete